MAKVVKAGVIGCGQIGLAHINGLNSSPNAEVIAVADVSKKRVKAAAKEHNVANAYEDYKELLANPDIDAITVALPNYLHAAACLDALAAGKHVCCEKPFAMNANEAQAIVSLAKKKRKTFMLGMNFRFNPNVQSVKAHVDNGDLGEVYHARSMWLRRAGIPRIGSWFTQKKYAGGGGMLDIGVHLLDATLHLMGNFKPKAVSGQIYTKFGNRGMGDGTWGMSEINKKAKFDVDDHAAAIIKLAGGKTVALEISWAAFQETPNTQALELFGTDGGASVFPPKIYKIEKKEYKVIEPDASNLALPAERMHHFVDSIVTRRKPICTMDQALAIQKILDAIYESSKTGKEVRIK